LERRNKEFEDRVPNRVAELGPDGLKKKADELAAAIAFISQPIPASAVNKVTMPQTGPIKFYPVKTYRTGTDNAGAPAGLDIESWPFYTEAYDTKTNYVYVSYLWPNDFFSSKTFLLQRKISVKRVDLLLFCTYNSQLERSKGNGKKMSLLMTINVVISALTLKRGSCFQGIKSFLYFSFQKIRKARVRRKAKKSNLFQNVI